MREIKFRAWDKDNKEIILLDARYDLRVENSWTYEVNWSLRDSISNKVVLNQRNGVLMQFTGLTDKNGKEIYEGDIVKSSNDGKDGCDVWDDLISKVSMTTTRGVKFDDFWDWEDENSIYNISYYEIIGNIYENSELLNATD